MPQVKIYWWYQRDKRSNLNLKYACNEKGLGRHVRQNPYALGKGNCRDDGSSKRI